MIRVNEKWQIVLVLLVSQMWIITFLNLYIDIHKALVHLSMIWGWGALTLLLAPFLRIYEYKEDKERKKQLQKLCNVLANLKNKSAQK